MGTCSSLRYAIKVGRAISGQLSDVSQRFSENCFPSHLYWTLSTIDEVFKHHSETSMNQLHHTPRVIVNECKHAQSFFRLNPSNNKGGLPCWVSLLVYVIVNCSVALDPSSLYGNGPMTCSVY
jgi:hypothetical protein